MSFTRRCLPALLAVAAIACGGGNEAAEAPAGPTVGPDGVPAWEHAVLPLDQRGADRIELVRDLAIGDRPDEENRGFYVPRHLAVDGDGRIYVVDIGDKQVRVFGPGGDELRVLGGPGQGPGELMDPGPIAVAGDRVVVNDRRNGRLSVWDTDGNHVADHLHGRRFDPGVLRGSPDGSLLVLQGEADGLLVPMDSTPGTSGAFRHVVARYSTGGEELSRWAVFPRYGLALMRPGGDISASYVEGYNQSALEPDDDLVVAVDDRGAAYLIETDEYRVRATDDTGATRWTLHAPFERQSYPVAERIDRRAANLSRSRSKRTGQAVAITRSSYVWDEYLPVLQAVQVDGHGHLWVYPTVAEITFEVPNTVPATRPVDVYSADGKLLYSGEVDYVEWLAAHGDHVWALESDRATDNRFAVRYRVVEPF